MIMSQAHDIGKLMEMMKSESLQEAQIRAILKVNAVEPVTELDDFPGEPYSRSDYEDEYDDQ